MLELCDGTRTVADIASELGAKYHTDVSGEVTAYLEQLVDRELVHDAA